MDLGPLLTPLVLQGLTAAAAAFGSWRAVRLQRFARDRRLTALAWFFGLLALSVLLHAGWQWQLHEYHEALRAARQTRQPRLFRPEGAEQVTLLLVAHHATMLAALGVGLAAWGRRRKEQAAGRVPAGWLLPLGALALFRLISTLVPLLLALEATLTLYLAVRALLNHVERRSRGALQVAAGFALLFVGHLLFFLIHEAGQGRETVGDIVALVGTVLLVQVLPGRR